MLYDIWKFHLAALAPLRLGAGALRALLDNPVLPVAGSGFGRILAASCTMLERAGRDYAKRAFGFTSTGRGAVLTEEIVWRSDFCELRHFRRPDGPRRPRLLLVAPISGHHATLLRPMAADLLEDHDVAVTDWVEASQVPLAQGGFDLDDQIETIMTALGVLGPGTHVVAVSQPAVAALAATALMAETKDPCRPASLTLIGGPVDVAAKPTPTNKMVGSQPLSWLALHAIQTVPAGYPGQGRKVYPGFLQLAGFLGLDPGRHLNAHWQMFHDMAQGDLDAAGRTEAFYDEFLAVMDMPAEFYLQTIETVFQKRLLAVGEMVWRGRRVDPGLIVDTALMTVEGRQDGVSPPGQCEAAHRLCRALPDGLRRHRLQDGAGHFGLFNGHHWQEEVLPDVRSFIRSHDPVLAGEKAGPDEPRRMGEPV